MAVKPEVSQKTEEWSERKVDIFLSSILTWCILELRMESLVYDQFLFGGERWWMMGGGNSERGLKWSDGG